MRSSEVFKQNDSDSWHEKNWNSKREKNKHELIVLICSQSIFRDEEKNVKWEIILNDNIL